MELDEQLQIARKVSGGTMEILFVVSDDAEKARALALNRGRHGGPCLEIVTEAELVTIETAQDGGRA